MPALPSPGTLINGKYRVVRLIGEGGMGAVFEARHEHLGLRVALKFLLPDLAERPGLVARFLQEARVSAAIRSPHVTQVMDVDQTPEGAPYLVMELLEGESLEQRLARGGRPTMQESIVIGIQILFALEAAHAHGVVHRDLKPDNVWLTPSPSGPQVKLLDFGIAKLKVSDEFRAVAVETRPGSMMGTPAYMAPEQIISADQVDARADLYSFGVMLYELLSGSRPVDADDPATILEKLVRGEIHPLLSRNPDLPPALCMLVDRLVAPNPDERPASAAYVRGELMRFVRITEHGEQRPSRVPPTVPPVDQGTPPFVTSSQTAAIPRIQTDAMPRMPDFAMAPTAVATTAPVVIPPRRRGVMGPVLVVLFLGALGGGGAWAYMNQSIFDDSALPPLPTSLPAPTVTATATAIERIDEKLPRLEEPRPRPPSVVQPRPTVVPVPEPQGNAPPPPTTGSPAQTGLPQLPLPPFILPSSLPFPITLPSGLPPIFQNLPGFSAPAAASSSPPPKSRNGAPEHDRHTHPM